METTISQRDLDGFTGTENYYQHDFGMKYTDGVKYLAEKAGAFWLIDLIASWQPKVLKEIKSRGERNFQAWILSKTEKGFRARCTNGNDVYILHQDFEFSTFPADLLPFTLWAIDGVMLLPSEY